MQLHDLSGVRVKEKKKKQNVFVLESERRNFYFQADDEAQMNEWIAVLKKYIPGGIS